MIKDAKELRLVNLIVKHFWTLRKRMEYLHGNVRDIVWIDDGGNTFIVMANFHQKEKIKKLVLDYIEQERGW